MDPSCHNFDVEARDPDKSRYPLGAGITLAASLGAELGQASGSASLLSPGGVAAQPPVRDQGPHARGERSRLEVPSTPMVEIAGGRVTPTAKGHLDSERQIARAQTFGILSSSALGTEPPTDNIADPSPGATSDSARLVGQRVDALVIAFALEVSPSFRDEIGERQSLADLAGTAQLAVASLPFAMKRSRRRDSVAFENADLRGMFDERAVGGWQLEVVARATYLATHSLEATIALASRVASGFGHVKGCRLRRFDLAVDMVGFPLARDDVERIVTRAKTDAFIPQSKDVDEVDGEFCKPSVREHRSASHAVTGFSIASGNPIMARIYDKTAELSQPGREEKRAIESAIWSQNGWNGFAQVTRIEFQHRGTYLDEIDLRDIDRLANKLDPVWQSDVRWLRFVDPKSATRLKRCSLDSRWTAVSSVLFAHQAEPVTRRRQRGGAMPEHVFGAAQSRLAAVGRITRIDLGVDGNGECLDERAFAARMTPDEAFRWLDNHVSSTFGEAAHDVARALRKHADPRDTVACLIAKHNSAVARFSSVDDDSARPNPANEGEDS